MQGLVLSEKPKDMTADIIPITFQGVHGFFISQDVFKDYLKLQQFQLTYTDTEKLYLSEIELYKGKIAIYESLQKQYDVTIKDYQKSQTMTNILRYTTEAGFILSGFCIAGLIGYIALTHIK